MDGEQELLKQIEQLKLENSQLRNQLENGGSLKKKTFDDDMNTIGDTEYPLSLEEYHRYGRQMIVEETEGVKGQIKLKNAKILVIGAGGLGCPSLPYLAGAGIGTIGIVDNDTIDTSNLHRQILHSTANVGMLKCESAKRYLEQLNPNVNVITYPVRLNNHNAFEIFKDYDLVLDCTDTPITRYLISDVAVNLGMTIVSASGVRTDGQLTILNFKNVGPCYRCFYPVPPSPNSVSSCSEGGVIGPCIGLVGVMMAVETIKLLLDVYTLDNWEPFLMQYSGFPKQSLRTFRMRGRKDSCKCCGESPTITKQSIESNEINYQEFCGVRNYDVCSTNERITVNEFEESYHKIDKKDYILLDVRPPHHYDISHLANTYNIPVKSLRDMDGSLEQLQKIIPDVNEKSEVVVMCRFGNDSRLATRLLKDEFKIKNVKDIAGGFFKYIDDIDQKIPKY
ncbi:similar to Saccharomyces cerevisiae YHR111W UBA4 Protein that activates Urm1p before its conjugation to proteins (urmylation) [Maudiozyma saulgeensis]|uniref:Needs CLA4 to survive protein 3 n=1 Tax=Maudiozyma saulgeensis TaxID=1789683 RepID=A0A1X7R273_9SACH|nr:similar to Saccharomyces cerevisiae YHR111W UBA4 Protein that activates Urm1p before its conjugation to proteins (urmylation) [Kazachstania saulgeensis]